MHNEESLLRAIFEAGAAGAKGPASLDQLADVRPESFKIAEVPLTPGDLSGLLRAASAIPSHKLGAKEFLASLVGKKNFHGSFGNPREGRIAKGNEAGFFTSDDPSHAEFFANLTGRNPAGTQGNVFAASPPKKPIDLTVDGDFKRVLDSFQKEHDQLDAVGDGLLGSDASRLRTGLKDAREGSAAGDFTKADAGLRSASLHYKQITGEDLFNKTMRELGHDAFITKEINPITGKMSKVTVYADRPSLIDHQTVVRRAADRGEDIPAFNQPLLR